MQARATPRSPYDPGLLRCTMGEDGSAGVPMLGAPSIAAGAAPS